MKRITILTMTVFLGIFISCDGSKKSKNDAPSLSMKVDMSLSKSGVSDTVIITSAKVLLKRIKFKSVGEEDSLDFRIGPFVVNLDLTGGVTEIAVGKIPNGAYDEIKFKIHKPEDHESISDPDFNTGNGEDERFSMIITGTYNGTPFTYKSKKDMEQEVEIDPPMVVTDSLPNANATLLVTPQVWFKKDGNFLDPANESNRNDIDDNIRKSFKKAFKDNDHDGHDGEDEDDDDHDDDHDHEDDH